MQAKTRRRGAGKMIAAYLAAHRQSAWKSCMSESRPAANHVGKFTQAYNRSDKTGRGRVFKWPRNIHRRVRGLGGCDRPNSLIECACRARCPLPAARCALCPLGDHCCPPLPTAAHRPARRLLPEPRAGGRIQNGLTSPLTTGN